MLFEHHQNVSIDSLNLFCFTVGVQLQFIFCLCLHADVIFSFDVQNKSDIERKTHKPTLNHEACFRASFTPHDYYRANLVLYLNIYYNCYFF